MAGISINNLPLGAESKYLSKVKIGNEVYYLKDAEVRAIVATLKEAQIREIAEIKLPDLNCYTVEEAMKIVEGTARNMGVKVED